MGGRGRAPSGGRQIGNKMRAGHWGYAFPPTGARGPGGAELDPPNKPVGCGEEFGEPKGDTLASAGLHIIRRAELGISKLVNSACDALVAPSRSLNFTPPRRRLEIARKRPACTAPQTLHFLLKYHPPQPAPPPRHLTQTHKLAGPGKKPPRLERLARQLDSIAGDFEVQSMRWAKYGSRGVKDSDVRRYLLNLRAKCPGRESSRANTHQPSTRTCATM